MDVDIESTFGRLLKHYRRRAHLTQEDLAARAGYSSHYVSMLERGVRTPQPITIDLLADALDLAEADRSTLHDAPNYRMPTDRPSHAVTTPALTLLGREDELTHIVDLLRARDTQVLTLTGPGGVGKTSLARCAVQALTPAFHDGTAWVNLATVTAMDGVIDAIASGLGLREMGSQSIAERLTTFLGERELLLVLDSFERVVEAAASIAELLATCPHLSLLVTSRTPLRLHAEHELRLRPLALPRLGETPSVASLLRYPAVLLFVHRARLIKPDFALDDASGALIVEICRRVDGLPLAIELAAARLTSLPLVALRDRLKYRLQMLTGGSRDLPPRQQRMRDTIAWSVDLLEYPERSLLRRLSIFVGSWSLEAAEEVCAPAEFPFSVLDGLRTLVDSSLVVPMDDVPDEPRYRMLDTVHEYALEDLTLSGELDMMERRHSAYYVRLAEASEPALQDRDQRTWYPRLEREHDNLGAALERLIEAGEAEQALQLGGAIWRFWQRHGDIREGRRWLERGLDKGEGVSSHVRARALWGASWLAYHQGDYRRTKELSAIHLVLARQHGDPLEIRNALTSLGMVLLAEGRYSEALQPLREALESCAPLGNIWHRATSFLNLGNATMLAGHPERAATMYEEAWRLYRERGDDVFAARARQHLAYAALLQGEYGTALTILKESLLELFNFGEKTGIADGLEAVAAVHAASGSAEQAARLVEAAANLREAIGVAPLPYLSAIWRPLVIQAETLVDRAVWAQAQSQGRALSLREAINSAVEG